MAKSWGARIVGRLFGSRSNKKTDAEGDETPTLEGSLKDSLLQHDANPDDEPLTKDGDQFSAQIRPETGDETAPTKGNTKAQMNVGRPHTLEKPSLSVQPAKENADGPATPLSNSARMQKPSPVRVHKSQSGRLADKASGVGEETATGETSNEQSVVSNGRPKQKPNNGAQRKVANKVQTKERSKADIKPEYRAEEFATTDDTVAALKLSRNPDLINVGQGSEKNTVAPIAPTSPLKRSRKQKTKVMDQQVTDKELSELEAENVRLKLLLSQKLKS